MRSSNTPQIITQHGNRSVSNSTILNERPMCPLEDAKQSKGLAPHDEIDKEY